MGKKVVEIITDTVQKDVSFLTDVSVKFVSLVKHGANRTPFKIVKSDNIGGVLDTMVIQSILIPKEQNFDALVANSNLNWLVDAKKENFEEYEEYGKYVQVPIEKFDQNSLGMVKLHDSGVWAVVGKIDKTHKVENALTLGKKELAKYMQIPVAPGNAIVAEVKYDPMPITFNEVFEKELYSFLDVVRGTLSQSSATHKQRRKGILGAFNAFRDFTLMGLDTIASKENTNKEDKELNKLDEKISQITEILKTLEKGGDTMLFKDNEEFEKAVSTYLEKRETEAKAKEDAKAKEEAELKAKTDAETKVSKEKETLATLTEQLTTISSKVKELTEKQDKIGNQLTTIPATNGAEEKPVEKKDTKSVSVFSGILN